MIRKEEILNSAETLARSRGIDGFSYADIERVVGIRKASIHHHFPSKANLSLAILQRYRERFAANLGDIAAKHSRASDRLIAYLDLYRDALSGGNTVCLCVAFSLGVESLSSEVLVELNAFNAESIGWLTSLFALACNDNSISGVNDPRKEAFASLSLANGAQLISRAANDVSQFEIAIAGLLSRCVEI